MDLRGLVTKFSTGQPAEVARVLRCLAHSTCMADVMDAYGLQLASSIVINLQAWDELFEQPGIDDLLNDNPPELQPGDEQFTAVAKEPSPRPKR